MDVKQTQRVTVTFRPGIYRALKASAVRNKRTISDVVNEAVERALREDALDAKAFHRTRKVRSIPYSNVRTALKREGLL